MIYMLDIPHYIYMKMKKRNSYNKEKVKDDWYFDFSYHYAFAISVYFITIIYSASAPLISFFGVIFFYFKVSYKIFIVIVYG